MKKTFLILSALALLVSCNSSSQKNDGAQNDSIVGVVEGTITETIVPDGSTAQNSLDYEGAYKGILPTASGEGMDVTIVLDKDTYTKDYSYVGKKIEPTKTKGAYTWDSTGTIITLEGTDKPNQYFVSENTLTQLDVDGKKITGDIANQYILQKQ